MASLGNLLDVDLTGKQNGDRLTYDETSGLWVPRSVFQPYALDVSYPEGDNGWTLVEEFDPVIAVDHVENTTDIPSNDNALVYSFTVTAAMLPVNNGATDLLPGIGLRLSVAANVAFSAIRSGRLGISVNDTQATYTTTNAVTTSRERVGLAMSFPVEEGDEVKVHLWRNGGDESETFNLTHILAAPTVVGWPNVTNPGKAVVVFDPGGSVTGSFLDVGPSGIDISIYGSTTQPLQYLAQQGEDSATGISSDQRWVHAIRSGQGRFPFRTRELDDDSTNGDPGNPLVSRVWQPTAHTSWVAVLDEPGL